MAQKGSGQVVLSDVTENESQPLKPRRLAPPPPPLSVTYQQQQGIRPGQLMGGRTEEDDRAPLLSPIAQNSDRDPERTLDETVSMITSQCDRNIDVQITKVHLKQRPPTPLRDKTRDRGVSF